MILINVHFLKHILMFCEYFSKQMSKNKSVKNSPIDYILFTNEMY